MTSATRKALIVWGLLWCTVILAPFHDKLHLTGLLWIPAGSLYMKIKECDDFLVRSAFSPSIAGVVAHPWFAVLALLVLWAIGTVIE